MAVLGPRVRRGMSRVVPGPTGGHLPLLPAATRMPAAPWKARDAFLVVGAGLLFLFLALIVALGLAQLQTADPETEATKATVSTIVSIGYYLFALGMIWLLIKQRYGCSWRTMGLRPVGWQWLAAVPIIYALWLFCYGLVLVSIIAVFGRPDSWPKPLSPTTIDATHQPALEALVIVTGVILTPLVEELLFRGVLYQALRRTMPIFNAALLSALVFAVLHFSLVLFVPYMVLGLILALVYERSGSIVPTMLVHACNNGILLIFFATR